MSDDNTAFGLGTGCETLRLSGQQRHSLMDGLQIFSQQVRVSAGHFQRAMPEYLLQVKHRAAFAQIVKRECVPDRVLGSGWRFKTKLSDSGV